MTKRKPLPFENEANAAFDELLEQPRGQNQIPASYHVPKRVIVALNMLAKVVRKRGLSKSLTAKEISIMTIKMLERQNPELDIPEVLTNTRAFGRYLGKFPEKTGFMKAGTYGNINRYTPIPEDDDYAEEME